MGIDIYKNNKKLLGSIIKFNRLNKNINQKTLSKGICVPSYISRIENGELLPSEDIISIIFERLGLVFNDSDEFLQTSKDKLTSFFEKLDFNEFDYTTKIFSDIESNENEYIASPLIIDYFLAKLARYSSTPEREKFESSQNTLLSAFELLSAKQKFLYNYYVGIDMLIRSKNKSKGKEFLKNALTYKETGHCYFWLSYAYRIENNPIKAYDSIKKALDLYLAEGNIISIMDSYEKVAEVHFMLNNYSDAIHYLKMSLNIATKLNNKYFIEHLNSLLAWTYYRLDNYAIALDYLKLNTGLIDHRMVIPDSVIKSLIYFSMEDKISLKKSIIELKNTESLEHIDINLADILYKFFDFYIKNEDYKKSHIWEGLLTYITDSIHELVELKKVFNSLLKDFYIHNRRYKDALQLMDTN